MAALAMMMPGAVSVAGPVIMIGRLDTAVSVALGPAPNTWSHRHVWMDTCQCAPTTHSWSTKWIATSRGSAAFGSGLVTKEARLRRPLSILSQSQPMSACCQCKKHSVPTQGP
eukprot:3618311-Amphidinium_carterae.1